MTYGQVVNIADGIWKVLLRAGVIWVEVTWLILLICNIQIF